jgi:hypothetical protein
MKHDGNARSRKSGSSIVPKKPSNKEMYMVVSMLIVETNNPDIITGKQLIIDVGKIVSDYIFMFVFTGHTARLARFFRMKKKCSLF